MEMRRTPLGTVEGLRGPSTSRHGVKSGCFRACYSQGRECTIRSENTELEDEEVDLGFFLLMLTGSRFPGTYRGSRSFVGCPQHGSSGGSDRSGVARVPLGEAGRETNPVNGRCKRKTTEGELSLVSRAGGAGEVISLKISRAPRTTRFQLIGASTSNRICNRAPEADDKRHRGLPNASETIRGLANAPSI